MNLKKDALKQRTKAHFDRFWRQKPEESPFESLKIKRLLKKLECKTPVTILDVGCGKSHISLRLNDLGFSVLASDVSSVVLKDLPLQTAQECLPYLKRGDESFDLCLCLDVIAEIEEPLHRLTLSELARVLKKGGEVVISTPLMKNTDALFRFLQLVETEFEIQDLIFSYHRLSSQLLSFFSFPRRYYRGCIDPEYRLELKYKGLTKNGFKALWKGLSTCFEPMERGVKKEGVLILLEKISKMVWGGDPSDVVVMGRKRGF